MMTKLREGCLTSEVIERLASGEFQAKELSQIEEHVESCTNCRNMLESTSWDAHWQDEVVPALRNWGSCQAANLAIVAGKHDALSIKSVMGLLGPTDDPHKLGRIGAYEISGVVGCGGMGVVLKAFDAALNRFVAIKMMLPHMATSGAARQRFQREGRAAAAIIDDCVLPIYGVDQWQGVPYLVMQYSAGTNLQKRLEVDGPLKLNEILRISMQTARGLAAAHAQGLVHRDVKPSNILLDGSVDRAMLCDFGLARAVDDASVTRTGMITGTPLYMSPEQVRGEKVDARSDLFSLGTTMYAMCTGHSPFRGESTYNVLHRLTHDHARPIQEINPELPAWLCKIIDKLISKQAANRYQTAQELAQLLERCIAHVQQPDLNQLPANIGLSNPKSESSFVLKSLSRKVYSNMGKISITAIALAGLIVAFVLQQPLGKGIEDLQGEWLLVASEREGQAVPADQLFNERLMIQGANFSTMQTAPSGMEIQGQSGQMTMDASDGENSINFKIRRRGTVYGIYKLDGNKLVLCITESGGRRPDELKTTKNDKRILQTYQRKAISNNLKNVTTNVTDSESPWVGEWINRTSKELDGSKDPETAMRWMRENGFQDIAANDITIDVIRRVHPEADEQRFRKDVSSYVYGLLLAQPENSDGDAIEAYCLFGADGKFVALVVGPRCAL